ncbi:MAG: flagellin [Selenomonas sp.]|uniref:flagellin n=1 Tax=Selenomonas sp. TaxID=2053611 RepID=UPI0025CBBB5D|nr:flagellin [Selenomonas sp.]MCI6099167.1 flagellin [Selenomonas sp.]MCI6232248.1 flagellin [Selenomonas sp.]
MSMVIRNDRGALHALNQVDRNANVLGESLKKVSSGMKINSAKDDASGFAISERMRVQIRSLAQDDQNVQTGKSLLQVADGAIANITEELRSLKELAINAANDSNTDLDRATIQKEFDQRRAQIDDIASTTNYNGRILLDGTYRRSSQSTVQSTVMARFVSATGSYVTSNQLTGLFQGGTPTSLIGAGYGVRAWADGLPGLQYNAQMCTNTLAAKVILDFSRATINGRAPTVPADFDQQGFTMMCQYGPACPEFISIRFDASQPIGQGQLLTDPIDTSTYLHHEYVVGISDATSINDVERAVFEGIKKAQSQNLWDE